MFSVSCFRSISGPLIYFIIMANSDQFRARFLISQEILDPHMKSEVVLLKLFSFGNIINRKMKPNNSTYFLNCLAFLVHTSSTCRDN